MKVYIVIDHEDVIQVYDNLSSAERHCDDYNNYYDCNSCHIVEVNVLHSY